MGWARTFLKLYGLIENTGRGRWALTAQGRQTKQVDPHDVYRVGHDIQNARSNAKLGAAAPSSDLRLFDGDKVTPTSKDLPPASELLIPTIQALRELGGTARKRDISSRVKELAQLSDEQTQLMYGSGRTTVYSIVINEVRKILSAHGLISVPQIGIYQLTDAGWAIEEDALAKLTQPPTRRRATRFAHAPESASLRTVTLSELFKHYSNWRDELFRIMHGLELPRLQALFIRLFASEGIDQVEIFNITSDSHIEGLLVSRGFVNFRVALRFVRGNELISTREVEDFVRQASTSRANKGMLITMGRFTEEALRAAERNSRADIELIDGSEFVAKLKQSGLSIINSERVIVERVVINHEFFDKL